MSLLQVPPRLAPRHPAKRPVLSRLPEIGRIQPRFEYCTQVGARRKALASGL